MINYNSPVLNIFTVVICKSCLFHLPRYLKKKTQHKITSIPLFIASFPIFTANGAFIKKEKNSAKPNHNKHSKIKPHHS